LLDPPNVFNLHRYFRILVSVVLDITQFGVCVVFLLLAAKNIHDFIESVSTTAPDVCWMLIIVSVALLPLTFLKSPERFWYV
jgi:amino acid permease